MVGEGIGSSERNQIRLMLPFGLSIRLEEVWLGRKRIQRLKQQ